MISQKTAPAKVEVTVAYIHRFIALSCIVPKQHIGWALLGVCQAPKEMLGVTPAVFRRGRKRYLPVDKIAAKRFVCTSKRADQVALMSVQNV